MAGRKSKKVEINPESGGIPIPYITDGNQVAGFIEISEELFDEIDSQEDPIYTGDFEEEIKLESSYIQWSVGENGRYIPCHKTIQKVPSGIYELGMSQELGFHIQRQLHFSDDLMELPMKETQEILADIKKFWNNEAVFKRYGYTHKRGILLHGPPGNGKSYLIQVLARHMINEMKGIVLNLKDHQGIELFLNYAGPVIRTIERDRPIIVLMEDIDNILEYSNSTLTKILNILDGLKQINKVVYIATTNYPEKLQERISNRPSRFDRKVRIGPPDAAVREYYIRHKLKKEDIKKIDVKLWVEETEGLSISHIKELIVSTIILGMSFEEALEIMKQMGNRTSSNNDGKGIGFSSLKVGTILTRRNNISEDGD